MIGAVNQLIVFEGGYFLAKLQIAWKTVHFRILNLFALPSIINLII